MESRPQCRCHIRAPTGKSTADSLHRAPSTDISPPQRRIAPRHARAAPRPCVATNFVNSSRFGGVRGVQHRRDVEVGFDRTGQPHRVVRSVGVAKDRQRGQRDFAGELVDSVGEFGLATTRLTMPSSSARSAARWLSGRLSVTVRVDILSRRSWWLPVCSDATGGTAGLRQHARGVDLRSGGTFVSLSGNRAPTERAYPSHCGPPLCHDPGHSSHGAGRAAARTAVRPRAFRRLGPVPSGSETRQQGDSYVH